MLVAQVGWGLVGGASVLGCSLTLAYLAPRLRPAIEAHPRLRAWGAPAVLDVAQVLSNRRALLTVLGTTGVVWAAGLVANAVVLAAVGITPRPELAGRVLVAGYLVGLLPAPPARVGVFETGGHSRAQLGRGRPLRSSSGGCHAPRVPAGGARPPYDGRSRISAMVLVSVIVPARDAAARLPSCLDGLTAEDIPSAEVELIVVDDASVDGTADLAARPGVRVLRGTGRGPAAAGNLGARRARGEILVFLDADAVPEPGWLEGMLWRPTCSARRCGLCSTHA
jgi:Glycosyl transferase family 2